MSLSARGRNAKCRNTFPVSTELVSRVQSEKHSGINAELLDARNQCSPIDRQTHRSAVCASNTTFGLAQDAQDLLPLRLVTLFGCTSRGPLVDFADHFSHNTENLVLRAVVVRN